MPDERYVLGIAYQAGPDPRIKKGADGSRDYFTPRELELASRTFLRDDGRQIGIEHEDGTVGHADLCESYIYRNPVPWLDDAGNVLASFGDWLLGALLDETSWALAKAGKLTGWSPQGSATRKRRA